MVVGGPKVFNLTEDTPNWIAPSLHVPNTTPNIVTSICHASSNQEFTSVNPKNVLIFGGTGFLSTKVTTGLHHKGHNVELVEFENDHSPSFMGLYRKKKLNNEKIKIISIKSDGISQTISGHNIDSIIFIPSLIFDGSSEPSVAIELKEAVEVLERFVNILEAVASNLKHHPIQVLLVTLSKSSYLNSIQKSWLKSIEVSASSYQGLYGIQTKIVRVDNVYGEWEGKDDGSDVFPSKDQSCLHVDKLVNGVDDLLHAQQNCVDVNSQCVPDEAMFAETVSWAEQYNETESAKKDVLFSTYFTSVKNPMYSYKIKTKSGFFMKQWFTSAHKLGLNLVILHDSFDESFVNRVRSIHPNIDFVETKNLHSRTTNDYRFYGFKKYLEDHPEVRRAVLTDMRDVKIFNDPFKPMEVIGDYIYIGIDVSFYTFSYDHSWLRSVLRNCHRSEASIDEVKLHPFLNAGVLGGSRHMLLTFLQQLTQYFDKSPHHLNCNMGTINIVGHKYFEDYCYSGYPIQSAFKLGMVGDIPQGQAIKHKDTENYFF